MSAARVIVMYMAANEDIVQYVQIGGKENGAQGGRTRCSIDRWGREAEC